MRVRAAILAFLFAAPAFAQCVDAPVLSVPFRLSMLDVAVDGNNLWTATAYGVALYDRTVDPPQLIATTGLPGTTRIVRPGGNGLLYAGSGNTLFVIRHTGTTLQIGSSVDAGAPINDIAVTPLWLFIATRNGIAQYSLLDPANPSRTAATFTTSQTAVTSLTILGSSLYAADGDSNVASFDVTTLQPLPAITGPPNTIAVHALNGKLLASSLVQTNIYSGTNNIGTLPMAITAIAPISGDTAFFASGDRTLRGIDLTVPGNPVDLFRDDLPATSGTINRINALAFGDGRIYAAAGDIGLASYDASSFLPSPLRGAAFAGATSVALTTLPNGTAAYAGTASGITEFGLPSLTQGRTWDGSHADVVWDGQDGLLLTSSGPTMTLWSLTSTIPTAVASTTFPAAINGAALIGTTAYVVLANGSLESADFSQQTPIPQAMLVPVKPSSIARSGGAIALAAVAPAGGTTQIAYFSSPTAQPQIVTIPGLPTTPVALSGSTAAVQTFQGISIVDFAAGTTSLLPNSNDLVAQQLVLSGTTLLELATTTLRVWSIHPGALTNTVTLPSNAMAMTVMEGSPTAVVTTATDVVTVALDQLARIPTRNLPPNGNAYYKKVLATANRIDLLGPQGLDIFSSTMRWSGSIRSATIVDAAAAATGIYTIDSNMTLKAWTVDGSPAGSIQLQEGADAQPLSIFAVDGAVWVSFIHGCSTGACDKQTLVFNGLSQTATMTGGVIDVVVSGSRAYAITDIPSEVRVIDVSNPYQPSIAGRAQVQAPLSIAYSAGTLFVVGNTLTPYSESGLTKGTDILGAYTTDGTVTIADQHLRIDGNCAALTGRTFAPEQFTLPQWAPATSFPTPATAHFIAVVPGTFYVLTDDSLEIWSDAPLPKPPRRPPAR